MEFYSSSKTPRPVRLCESTRKFAYESLNHKYGLDAKQTPCVTLDHVENFEQMTELEQHDVAIKEIVTKAPVRICESEKISGAATLGKAIEHVIPATYRDMPLCSSVSHLTIDFPTVLKYGIKHIRENALISLERYQGTEKEAFAKSCLHCLDCFDIWHGRYLEALKGLPEYEANYRNLLRMPMEPANNFYEAVQSLWFTFAFVRLCGNWPGIGRIDAMLGPYLKRDLEEGNITLNEAREILAHLFIKGCEWIWGGNCESGDAQHYQNIILAGVDENGQEITNEVTYLVLDILEELGISDFPTTVRVNANTDEKLIRRVAEVIRYGGGILAVYNEDLILEALTEYGYPLTEARQFANDGCWEVQIPGKTFFNYSPFDSLQILQHNTLKDYSPDIDFADFESLYKNYVADLKARVDIIFRDKENAFIRTGLPSKDWVWKAKIPCTIVSLFEQGCIEKGLSYLEGGPIYNVISPHIGGLPDTVNSLYVIKKMVFDEHKISLKAFMEVLRNNWENEEVLRQNVLNNYQYYGNDNDEVDMIAVRLIDDFAEICRELDGRCGYNFPAGISTFGRQLSTFLSGRIAAPHGRKKGEVLAGNMSPTPGTDKEGATAIIRSYCKADMKRMVTGAALDVKLLPSSVKGEDGLEALMALICGFAALGGFFMQLDVVEAETLKEAQKHPEDYQTLSVRVSGWNARFVTLNEEWQNMIIQQTEK